jgi:hypothetical protein
MTIIEQGTEGRMAEQGPQRSTDARDAIATVRAFIRALHRGDAFGVAACCYPDAQFVVEEGRGVCVATTGPHTFTQLYAPRPGAAYWLTGLRLHPAPGGVVAVWRAAFYGRQGRRLLGVSVFQIEQRRIRSMECTYVPVPETGGEPV